MSENPAISADGSFYPYSSAGPGSAHAYLLPLFETLLRSHVPEAGRAFEIGAGNGFVADQVGKWGFRVDGIEPSADGVSIAQKHYPDAQIRLGSAYDDLSQLSRHYDVVYALEVIEHLYSPRKLVAAARDLLKPGGILILSTPYHGYFKNLALAVSGKLDRHFTALWDHGHIKFWSVRTLSALLSEQDFQILRLDRVGRLPVFAKSMIVTARRPA